MTHRSDIAGISPGRSLRVLGGIIAGLFALSALSYCGSSPDNSRAPENERYAYDPSVSDSLLNGEAFQSVEAHRRTRFWETSDLPKEFLQASCGECHRTIEVEGAPLLTQGRKLIREKGCVGCHDISEFYETIEKGPNLDDIGNKVKQGWLFHWLKKPREYLANTGMPTFRFGDEKTLHLVEFLMSLNSKNNPPRPVKALPSEAGDPERGEILMRESRCITCHSIYGRGGTIAPELEMVGDKVNEEWMANYLLNVHYYQPEKTMLQFNFAEQDALDIASYMMEEFSEDEYDYPLDDPESISSEKNISREEMIARGRSVFLGYGCRGCHDVTGIERLKVAPPLTDVGDRDMLDFMFGELNDAAQNLPNWLYMKLKQPDIFSDLHNMPDFSLTDNEALAITVALVANKTTNYPSQWLVTEKRQKVYTIPEGIYGELFEKYSCLTCHSVQGYGGSVSTAPLTTEGSKVRREWLKDFLIRPHAVRPILPERMPYFRMSDSDAAVIADYIKEIYVDNDLPKFTTDDLTEDEALLGEELFEKKQCVSCHIINGAGGYVGPKLDDVSKRLEPEWLFAWLKDPIRYRSETMQPDYGFTDIEARRLTAFLMLGSQKDTDWEVE